MKTIKTEITTNQVNEINESITRIKAEFTKVFPNGYINVGLRRGLGSPYLYIDLGLIGENGDCQNNIRENDPLYTSLMAHNVLAPKFETETLQSGLNCEPEEGSYMAMSLVKTAYRKTTGDLPKLEKSLKNYFKKIGKIVLENQANIYRLDHINPKYLEINA